LIEREQGDLTIGRKAFEYSDNESWAALFFRDYVQDDPALDLKEGLPMHILECESGSESLTIEMWYDSVDDTEKPEREAFTSRLVSSREIEILQLSSA
jgi:hypothetical protein